MALVENDPLGGRNLRPETGRFFCAFGGLLSGHLWWPGTENSAIINDLGNPVFSGLKGLFWPDWGRDDDDKTGLVKEG